MELGVVTRLPGLAKLVLGAVVEVAVLQTANRSRIDASMVLTVGMEGWGGVLKGGEGLVLPEALGQVLGGLRVELVVAEAANRAESGVS